ncbi:hypothetical protein Tco_0260954 [Tanacetum coccineum]
MLEVEDFTNWKKRFMCHIIGIEPLFKSIIQDGPYVPMTAGNRKPESQWSTNERKDSQDSPDDEEDTRSSQEYMNDREEEFHKRALLVNSKRPTKDFEAKYNKVKAKLALLSSGASTSKSSMVKNKGLVAEAYEWDEEDVSSDDNEWLK